MGHPFGFIADANALLPHVHFIEGAMFFGRTHTPMAEVTYRFKNCESFFIIGIKDIPTYLQ